MQQRSITKPCLKGQISMRSLILWLIIDLHWRQTILWTMTRGHFLGNRALIFTQPPAEEQQAVSCQRAPLSEMAFRSLAAAWKGRCKGASAHLSVGDLGAPGPRLPAGCRPRGHLAAPVLLQALQQQVVNGSKMVVAAVLQGLEDIGRTF